MEWNKEQVPVGSGLLHDGTGMIGAEVPVTKAIICDEFFWKGMYFLTSTKYRGNVRIRTTYVYPFPKLYIILSTSTNTLRDGNIV